MLLHYLRACIILRETCHPYLCFFDDNIFFSLVAVSFERCLSAVFFMLFLLGVHSASWICGFILCIKFGKFGAPISSNNFSVPLIASLAGTPTACTLRPLKMPRSFPFPGCFSFFHFSFYSQAFKFTRLFFCDVCSAVNPAIEAHGKLFLLSSSSPTSFLFKYSFSLLNCLTL